MTRIKELPIGIQQVFQVDSASQPNNKESTDDGKPPMDTENKKSWMDVLIERVKDNTKKRELLNSLLNNLTNKV
jgi:hypothetical protein